MPSPLQETEIKLPLRDPAAVRRRLLRLGFRVVHPRSFEDNTLYDTGSRTLKRRGCLLRLRSYAGRSWLTFKGPAASSRRFKERAEIEVEVLDRNKLQQLLRGLGYAPGFRYQKFRTVFRAPSPWQGGEVTVDKTPIGNFLELEGSRRWIRRLARALGYSVDDFITATYADLYLAWCRRHRRRAGHMVFRSTGRRPS